MVPRARSKPNTRGQALIEYILLLAIATGMAVLLYRGFIGASRKLQGGLTCEIAAACPNCPVSSEMASAVRTYTARGGGEGVICKTAGQ
jgi:hypothetical protein